MGKRGKEVGVGTWSELREPGEWDGEHRPLADIRAGRATPDLGGPEHHPTAGAVSVGARLALVAFNVLLPGMSMVEAGALARSLRESRAGMRGVQAPPFDLPRGPVHLSIHPFPLTTPPPTSALSP